MDLKARLPAKVSFLNANGTTSGVAALNNTVPFSRGATVFLSGTSLPTIECWVTSISPTSITLIDKTKGVNGGSDISAYTTAANACVTQNEQYVEGVDASRHLYPYKVTLETLNAPPLLIGTITSTTSKNNANTAVPFFATNQAMKELVVTIQPDVACAINVGTDNTVTATTTGCLQLQAGEKLTMALGPNQGWIACVALSGGTCNLSVYRHALA